VWAISLARSVVPDLFIMVSAISVSVGVRGMGVSPLASFQSS